MNETGVMLSEFQKKVKNLEDHKNIFLIRKILKNALSTKLNVFEMIGLGRQEIRHSYFLRWLCGDNDHDFGHYIFLSFLSMSLGLSLSSRQC